MKTSFTKKIWGTAVREFRVAIIFFRSGIHKISYGSGLRQISFPMITDYLSFP